jgi:hypothetical protein
MSCTPEIDHMNTETNHGTEGIVAPNPERELTYGEKAVGLSFNPSGDPAVHRCKVEFAAVIDRMHELFCANGCDDRMPRLTDQDVADCLGRSFDAAGNILPSTFAREVLRAAQVLVREK